MVGLEQAEEPQPPVPAQLAGGIRFEQRGPQHPRVRARRLQLQLELLAGLQSAARLGNERVPLRVGAEVCEHPPHLLGGRMDVGGGADLLHRLGSGQGVGHETAPRPPLRQGASSPGASSGGRLGAHTLRTMP